MHRPVWRSCGTWLVVLWAVSAEAREARDLLRLTNGREIPIRQGWQASYQQGSFWFEYVRPHRLACTLPLQDVAEILTADGTVYQNTYEPPPITFSNRVFVDVYGTIVEHASRYPSVRSGSVNSRGWNSRTGNYEPP